MSESVVAQVGFGEMPGWCEFGTFWDFGDRPVEPTLVSIESFHPRTDRTSGEAANAHARSGSDRMIPSLLPMVCTARHL